MATLIVAYLCALGVTCVYLVRARRYYERQMMALTLRSRRS